MTSVDIENRILETSPAAGANSAAAVGRPSSTAGPNFDQILQDRITSSPVISSPDLLAAQAARAGIKFSGHAQTRMASRQIALSGEDVARLGDAITRAASKGARESLVLVNQAALVVSVPNRTVITAVDKNALKENIFTNIDSAVIL